MQGKTSQFKKDMGFTLAEILLVALLMLAGLASAMFVLSSSRRTNESIAFTSNLEDGWQRFMLQLREDIRSAQAVKLIEEKLHLVAAKMQHESMNVSLHEVIYFLDHNGNFVRQQVGEGEKKIGFSGQISSLKSSLWFTINGSESVRIKVNVVDTAIEKSVFNREELVKIASEQQ